MANATFNLRNFLLASPKSNRPAYTDERLDPIQFRQAYGPFKMRTMPASVCKDHKEHRFISEVIFDEVTGAKSYGATLAQVSSRIDLSQPVEFVRFTGSDGKLSWMLQNKLSSDIDDGTFEFL